MWDEVLNQHSYIYTCLICKRERERERARARVHSQMGSERWSSSLPQSHTPFLNYKCIWEKSKTFIIVTQNKHWTLPLCLEHALRGNELLCTHHKTLRLLEIARDQPLGPWESRNHKGGEEGLLTQPSLHTCTLPPIPLIHPGIYLPNQTHPAFIGSCTIWWGQEGNLSL